MPAGNPNGCSTLEDLCGAAAAVLKGSAQETILNDLNSDVCVSGPIEILSQTSDADAPMQLQSGWADASVAQEATG